MEMSCSCLLDPTGERAVSLDACTIHVRPVRRVEILMLEKSLEIHGGHSG